MTRRRKKHKTVNKPQPRLASPMMSDDQGTKLTKALPTLADLQNPGLATSDDDTTDDKKPISVHITVHVLGKTFYHLESFYNISGFLSKQLKV